MRWDIDMDEKDEIIKALISAVNAAYEDAVYWAYENSATKPQQLNCYEEVQAAIHKSKELGY
jgi:hypothetical protein